jgi:hypothetical protein
MFMEKRVAQCSPTMQIQQAELRADMQQVYRSVQENQITR